MKSLLSTHSIVKVKFKRVSFSEKEHVFDEYVGNHRNSPNTVTSQVSRFDSKQFKLQRNPLQINWLRFTWKYVRTTNSVNLKDVSVTDPNQMTFVRVATVKVNTGPCQCSHATTPISGTGALGLVNWTFSVDKAGDSKKTFYACRQSIYRSKHDKNLSGSY